MLSRLGMRIIRKLSNLKPESKRIDDMAKKIQAMNQTMNKTSPKLFSIFMMLTTLPTFYFGHKLITSEYNSQQFSTCASAGLTYINVKNFIFFACISILQKFKFNAPTAKHTLPRLGIFGTLAPPLLSLIAFCLPKSDNKYIVFPTLFADISMLVIQTQAANYGLYPFWLYSYRHYIRFLDWIVIGATFFALRNLQKRVNEYPHQFTEQQGKQNQTKTSL